MSTERFSYKDIVGITLGCIALFTVPLIVGLGYGESVWRYTYTIGIIFGIVSFVWMGIVINQHVKRPFGIAAIFGVLLIVYLWRPAASLIQGPIETTGALHFEKTRQIYTSIKGSGHRRSEMYVYRLETPTKTYNIEETPTRGEKFAEALEACPEATIAILPYRKYRQIVSIDCD